MEDITQTISSSRDSKAAPRNNTNALDISSFPRRIHRALWFSDLPLPRGWDQVDDLEFVSDVEGDFDLIVVPNDLLEASNNSSLEQTIQHCSNPAAPLISFSDAVGQRADVIVAERTAAGLADAIRTVLPIAKRVSALPRIPTGAARSALLALNLAYTRNCSITASWQPNSPAMIDYPLLVGVCNARSVLEEMANAGLLQRRFFDRIHICEHCESSRLVAREVCPSCRSSHLAEHSLVHHYACGHQAPQAQFDGQDGYICPKCRKQLRHYGVDYDKPGSVVACRSCGDTVAEPEVGFVCTDCGGYTSGDRAMHRDWYHYDLLPDGVAALRSGSIPQAHFMDANGGRTLRDFRLIGEQNLRAAQRYGRPIVAYRMTIDDEKLSKNVGRRGFLEVCGFVRELVAQNSRESDVVAALPTGVVACLPETSLEGANRALVRLSETVSKNVRPKIEVRFEIYEGEKIESLLKDLQ